MAIQIISAKEARKLVGKSEAYLHEQLKKIETEIKKCAENGDYWMHINLAHNESEKFIIQLKGILNKAGYTLNSQSVETTFKISW